MGEDWVFLAVLGIIMSFVSYTMDYAIDTLNHSRFWLYQQLGDALLLSYIAWSALPTFLILFSAGIVHLVAPSAAGSGIPELKTIFRGVMLKDFLSGKTLIAKSIGLMCTLGAGMPLGKEGPFVHIASIVATGLSNLVTSFKELICY
jgi:chloride channel 2